MRVAVVGAGSWGTTVASLVCANAPTVLWARRKELADEIATDHRNSTYLPTFTLPEALEATSSLEEAITRADVVVMAVPSHGFREVLAEVADHLRAWVPVVSLTKGLEQGSRKRMTEVVDEVLPGHPTGVLSGPNLAKEIMAGQPAASVLAMADERVALALQELFSTPILRIYTNTDIVGCELGGVLKNVVAIAAGMADGLGFGDNTRATLVTRGLAEITRLGVALGGNPLTFAGLAGMGDLVATCASRQSRNRAVGEQLAQGRTLHQVTTEMATVAEGVKSAPVVRDLAESTGVEMPISEAVAAVVVDGRDVRDALGALMSRRVRAELHGIVDTASPTR